MHPSYAKLDRLPDFKLEMTTEAEVRELPINIPDNMATGHDRIRVKFLKANLDVTVHLLTHVINTSIISRSVPFG